MRGLIIRHLVLPDNLARSDLVLPWIAREISEDAYVNIMAQYHFPTSISPPKNIREDPKYRALLMPVTALEYADAIRWGREAGLHRGF
jgi:putative pyruvate formate lyase activating enzyme